MSISPPPPEVREQFNVGKECFFKHSEHCWLLGVVDEERPKNEFVVSSCDTKHIDVGRCLACAEQHGACE